MARTASMTANEVATLLGPRGSCIVSTENRGTVREWLVAMGLTSEFAGTLPLTTLAQAYNDTTGMMLGELRERDAANPTQAAKSVPAVAVQGGFDQSRIASVIAAVLAILPPSVDTDTVRDLAREIVRDEMTERKPEGVDAAAVLAILRAELPNLIPVTRLVVTRDGKEHDHGSKPRHAAFERVFKAIARGHHVALVGPAGSGKTTLAEQVAEALGINFYMNGAITGAHELIGYKDATGVYHTTPFRQSFEFGGLWLGDEFDGGDASAPLVTNSALANGHMPFPDSATPVKRHPDFRCIVAANTYGSGADRVYVGRTQLDGATIDRFRFVTVDYDAQLEKLLTGNDAWVERVQKLRAAATAQKARLIISPRASISGAQALADGEPLDVVESDYLWKGADDELRGRLYGHAGLRPGVWR